MTYPLAGQVGLRLEIENYEGNQKRVQSRIVLPQRLASREMVPVVVDDLVRQIMDELDG